MGFISESKRILRSRFVSGILVVVPLILTFVLLKALVEFIDGLLRPLLVSISGHTYDFPFAGVIITLALILLTGILTTNVIGSKLVKLWDRQLLRIPIVNFVYGSAKQLVQALSIPQSKSFKSVVLIEYPRRGAYMLAFLVNEISLECDDKGQKLLSVFIPSSPAPISGFVALFPENEIILLDMTVEQGIRFLVSGSIISPGALRGKILPSGNPIGARLDKNMKASSIDESQ
jgi:uncharacterized membrane protein